MKYPYGLFACVVSLFMSSLCSAGQTEAATVKRYSFPGMKEVEAKHRSLSAYAWEGEFEVDGV